jgi:zinc transporter 5/7
VVKVPNLRADIAGVALARICSIALPIYAALEVNGFLVALGLLLAAASGLPALAKGRAAGNDAREKLGHKKFTVALILTILVLSFFGWIGSHGSKSYFGYLSLLLSVFVIPPQFADVGKSDSSRGPGFGVSASSKLDSSVYWNSGSLSVVSPDDGMLTLILGLVAGLAGFVLFGIPSLSALDAMYLLATAGSYATSLLFSNPPTLRSPHKWGLATGNAAAGFLSSPPVAADNWVVYALRCTLAAVSFFAARFDDRRLRLERHSHHHHHHGHSAAPASRVSKVLLCYSEPYPLLYSILKERDSRRIFYFMTYACPLLCI